MKSFRYILSDLFNLLTENMNLSKKPDPVSVRAMSTNRQNITLQNFRDDPRHKPDRIDTHRKTQARSNDNPDFPVRFFLSQTRRRIAENPSKHRLAGHRFSPRSLLGEDIDQNTYYRGWVILGWVREATSRYNSIGRSVTKASPLMRVRPWVVRDGSVSRLVLWLDWGFGGVAGLGFVFLYGNLIVI